MPFAEGDGDAWGPGWWCDAIPSRFDPGSTEIPDKNRSVRRIKFTDSVLKIQNVSRRRSERRINAVLRATTPQQVEVAVRLALAQTKASFRPCDLSASYGDRWKAQVIDIKTRCCFRKRIGPQKCPWQRRFRGTDLLHLRTNPFQEFRRFQALAKFQIQMIRPFAVG
jgi:hypothetical protein